MPHRLLATACSFLLSACASAPEPPPEGASPPPIDRVFAAQDGPRAALIRSLDSVARAPVEAGQVAGLSVAVVHGSDTLLLKGYGRADLELDVPTPEDAVYDIASVSKQFTAAAILQLAEEGRLDLDDELTKYLPDYPVPEHPVTLRHLLDHTAGIRGYMEMPGIWEIIYHNPPRDTLVDLIAAEPFDFPPGEAMIYSNSGYFLLGLIIEQVSGMSYEDYVEQRIFAPLGMERSRYCSTREVVEDRARGYDKVDSSAFVRAEYVNYYWSLGAAGLCSTAGDLIAWSQALHSGRVLGQAAYREMVTPARLRSGHLLRYAKGVQVEDYVGRPVIRHGGEYPGFVSEVRFYPEEDLHIVVLMNTVGPAEVWQVGAALTEAVLGPAPEPKAEVYTGDLDRFVGRYSGAARWDSLTVWIERGSGGLTVRMGEDEEPKPLHYRGESTFASEYWRFISEPGDGRARQLHVDRIGGHYVLRRNDGVQHRATEDR